MVGCLLPASVAIAAPVSDPVGVPPVSASGLSSAATLPARLAPVVPKLDWKGCGGGFQCATARVPLDYDSPRGKSISLALIRLPASDPAKRIGSLFTNPGGPGGSGVGFIRGSARQLITPAVRARFDIIGFDPRGVGGSTPVRCFSSAAEQMKVLGQILTFPTTAAAERRYVALSKRYAASCEAHAGELLRHVSTANVARDMDLLRQAVGDKLLTYSGVSYGTYLGATYANLFPSHVRALALDGMVDAPAYASGPSPSTTFVRQHSEIGSSATLNQFFTLCNQAGPAGCAFAAGGDPRAKFATLAARLRRTPLIDPSGVSIGYAELVVYTVQSLYFAGGWAPLAKVLQQIYALTRPADLTAAAGALEELARSTPLPQTHLPSAATAYNNSRDAQLASICGESTNPRDPAAYAAIAAAADRRAPYVGSYWSYIALPCAFWQAKDPDRYMGPWSVRTATPPLLFTTRYDPATPYQNAGTMQRLLTGSRVVTVNGWGHTALLTFSPCAAGYLERYLINRTLPVPGVQCPTGVVPFGPTS